MNEGPVHRGAVLLNRVSTLGAALVQGLSFAPSSPSTENIRIFLDIRFPVVYPVIRLFGSGKANLDRIYYKRFIKSFVLKLF